MIYAFISGALLAIGLIMPLGIQNIFIFNQGASQHHFLHALPSVLTASLCDAILILLAVLGVSVVVMEIAWLKTLLSVVGVCFLIYMGFVSWYSRPEKSIHAGERPLSAARQIKFTMSVSLLNPHALLDTIGVIGSNSLQYVGPAKIAFTLACILVSCLWFFTLSVLGHFVHQFDKSGLWQRWGNKASAVVIWFIAFYIGIMLFISG